MSFPGVHPRTGDPDELATTVCHAEADIIDFDLVRLRCRGGLNSGRCLAVSLYGVKVFVEFCLLFHTLLLAALFGALLNSFGPLLRNLVVNGWVDQLHMPIMLDDPSRPFIGLRRSCGAAIGRRFVALGSARCGTCSVVVQDQRAIEDLASTAARRAVRSSAVWRPAATSATTTLSDISHFSLEAAAFRSHIFTIARGRLITLVLLLLLLLLLVDVDATCGESALLGSGRRSSLALCGLPANAAIFACNSLSSDILRRFDFAWTSRSVQMEATQTRRGVFGVLVVVRREGRKWKTKVWALRDEVKSM